MVRVVVSGGQPRTAGGAAIVVRGVVVLGSGGVPTRGGLGGSVTDWQRFDHGALPGRPWTLPGRFCLKFCRLQPRQLSDGQVVHNLYLVSVAFPVLMTLYFNQPCPRTPLQEERTWSDSSCSTPVVA